MRIWIAPLAALLAILSGPSQEPPAPPATSQPATQPADTQPTLRKPLQHEILKRLIEERENPRTILPRPPDSPVGSTAVASQPLRGPDGSTLLLEGTMVVERTGRLIVENGVAKFMFHGPIESIPVPPMEILKNQYLELMEQESRGGTSQFRITAEVTLHRARNYLLIRKFTRFVEHGNLGP